MADEEKKPATSGTTKLLATFGMALIMFFAGVIWRAYERTGDALQQMTDRVKALEEDKSKWGTLTELHNKTISMEIEMGRLQGRMEGFFVAVQGGLVEKPELPAKLPPLIPLLKDPKDLFKNPDDYRNMQQQKYPLPPSPQKK